MDKWEEIKRKVDDAILKKQFGYAFQVALKQLIELVKGTQQVLSKSQKNEFERIETALDNALSSFRAETQFGLSETSKKQEERINKALFTIESLVSEAQSKIDEVRDGENGMDADEERVITQVLARIPPPELKAEKIRDLLESIEGEDAKTRIEAIGHLREELDELKNMIKLNSKSTFVGGAPRTNFVDDESLTGTIDGVNTLFYTNGYPTDNSLKVFRGGARQRVGQDYTVSGKAITFIDPPQVGEILLADYRA